jgi:hypothetical protein
MMRPQHLLDGMPQACNVAQPVSRYEDFSASKPSPLALANHQVDQRADEVQEEDHEEPKQLLASARKRRNS